MRPLRIAIEGLRSFRAEVAIDFGRRTRIAVIGDTGAGKSSILEAMTYALYGQTSLGGRSKRELMNDTSDVMRVVLRFRVAGEEWEVTRVDRRAGAGGLRPPQAQLVRYGPGGETLERFERVRPVNDRVQELIGLDSDAFLRTVILPQGRFARLLVEDGPSARTEILRQVWRTRDLEAAGEVARQRLGEARTLGLRLQDEVGRYPEDPEEHLADLTSRADAASRQAVGLADLRDRSARAADILRRSGETIAAARRARERVTLAAMDEMAGRLAPLESLQRRMEAETTELEGRQVGLKRELNGIPTDDGPDDREIARTLAALDALPDEVAKAVSAAEALRGAIAGEAEAAKRHVRTTQALESASDRLARHRALEPPLADAVGSARELLARGERWFERCGDLRERIGSAEDGLARQERETDEVTARLGAAQRDLQGAQDRRQRTELELGEAQRTNAAAAAAHGLCPGDECPVCRQGLPEGWVAPRDTGLDAAREARRQARSQSDEASRVVADLEARQKSGRQRIADAGRDLGDLRSSFAGALGRLRNAAGPDAAAAPAPGAPLPDREHVLAQVRTLLREAEAKLGDHRTEAEGMREAQTSAHVEETSARQTLKHARREIDRTRKAAGEILAALNRNLQSVPPPFRPRLDLPPDPVELHAVDATPVDRASYAARERERILQSRKRERDRLRTDIEAAGTAMKRLEEARKTQVEEPLQALVRALASHRTALAEALREITADIAIPAAIHYPVDAKALREGIGQLREAMVEAVALAEQQQHGAQRAAHKTCAEAVTLARMLVERLNGLGEVVEADALAPLLVVDTDALPVLLDDWEAAVDVLVSATGRAATDAGYAARTATEIRDAFAAILDDLLRLRRTAAEVAALELALGDLDAALKPGAFLKWLTLRRSRDLLVYASRMLEKMTGGRYAFADPGDLEDQQWLVVDNDSGQARSPASLSGGEQFIGSLALALGMVEMMARSGGRLESLFLDEGFGSLDRSNLDSAIESLSMVAGTGRMVGVISHVGAVAEQIDDVLAVARGATGSRVTWLSRAERRDLARSDTGPEGASALAGLLE